MLDPTKKYAIINDLFCIPHEDIYILYRPTIHAVSFVNKSAIDEISFFLNSNVSKTINSPVLARLEAEGFFDEPKVIFDPSKPLINPNAEFKPYEVTLDLTWRCNLKCIYCYAMAGENDYDMDWNCAIAAIDLCIDNCLEDNERFVLRFHGSGEPTQNWNMLKELVNYSKTKTSKYNIKFLTTIATNGVISNFQAKWIAKNIDMISLSYDGDAFSQNKQRPTSTGEDSSEIVMKTANFWKSNNKKFNIRATITKNNVNNMLNICASLGKAFPETYIDVEPMTICGRGHNIPNLAPDPISFANNFVKANLYATRNGIRISYSGTRFFSIRKYFCGASTPNFSIMADGTVTACFSYSAHEFIRELFVYGRWDEREKKFQFYQNIISQLRQLSVDQDPYCNNCFARYHCTGDCPAVRKFELLENKYFVEVFDVDFGKNRRCKINRTIIKLLLLELLKNKEIKNERIEA